MSCEYFAITPTGYARQANVSIQPVDHSRQIPVYKTVSQYMNLNSNKKEEQIKPAVIEQEDEEQEMFTSQMSTHSLKMPYQNAKRFKFFITSQNNRENQKNEVKSFQLDDQNNQKITPLKNPMMESTISNSPTVFINGRFKNRNQKELQSQKVDSQEDSVDGKVLYLELEKQKVLRKNLEKSYRDLLARINKKQRLYSVDISENQENQRTSRTPKAARTVIKKYNQSESQSSENQEINGEQTYKIRLRRENKRKYSSEEKAKLDIEEQQRNNKSQQNQSFLEHLRVQEQLSARTFEELNEIKIKINTLEDYMKKRDEKIEKEKLENDLKDKEKELLRMQMQNSRLRTIQECSLLSRKQPESVIMNVKERSLLWIFFTVLCLLILTKEAIC